MPSEVGHLALTIRHRCRNAVGIQPHAADAESRTCTEATNRDLLVLRIVLPITGDHARNAREQLRRVDIEIAAGWCRNHVNRGSDIKRRLRRAGGGDHHGRQLLWLGQRWWLGRADRQRQDRQRGGSKQASRHRGWMHGSPFAWPRGARRCGVILRTYRLYCENKQSPCQRPHPVATGLHPATGLAAVLKAGQCDWFRCLVPDAFNGCLG